MRVLSLKPLSPLPFEGIASSYLYAATCLQSTNNVSEVVDHSRKTTYEIKIKASCPPAGGQTVLFEGAQCSRSSISLVPAEGFRDFWPSADARRTLLDAAHMT